MQVKDSLDDEINSDIYYVVTEGFFLQKHGISPYQGDLVHQPPLLLNLLRPVHAVIVDSGGNVNFWGFLLFVAMDVGAALLVLEIFRMYKKVASLQYEGFQCLSERVILALLVIILRIELQLPILNLLLGTCSTLIPSLLP
jgi:hypothetical protein